MIRNALQYIVGLAEPSIREFHGASYADKEMTRICTPLAGAREVNTLTALLTYLRDNVDGLNRGNLMLHVVSPTAVHLISGLNADMERETYLAAIARTPGFQFGNFYSSESFNIAIQSMFTDAEDRPQIIKMAGNLMEEGVKTSTDDGMTQTAVVKTGVKVVGYESVPNPVTLRPYRTFSEVEQPASKFVFRIREGATLALFEADGGAWKNEAMNNIKDYMAENLEELGLKITILA